MSVELNFNCSYYKLPRNVLIRPLHVWFELPGAGNTISNRRVQ
jgi:hypothetical protein